MKTPPRPKRRPKNPHFSSGPCPKPPGWSLAWLQGALLGRSHRSPAGKEKLMQAIDETRSLLSIPDDYRIAIVPGSDTGAVELALWSLLGPRGVDVVAFDVFGEAWAHDIAHELKLKGVRQLSAPHGMLPDLSMVSGERDVVVTANGTTSGVRLPDYDWIADDRQGLVFVDATSSLFAQPIAWLKTDVVTFSWQKVLGGEAAHGMLILSPRAYQRAATWQPPWPVPKLFRLTVNGKFNEALFRGETLNTPSMLCVEDYLAALSWVREIGGVKETERRAQANAGVLWAWLERSDWAENAAVGEDTRSNTSVCLRIKDATIAALSGEAQFAFCRALGRVLEAEGVAFDIAGHRFAPPGLRIWAGATVEAEDLLRLTLWLDWAFQLTKAGLEIKV